MRKWVDKGDFWLNLSRDCFASGLSHFYCAGILWESVSDTPFQSSVCHIGRFYTRVAIPVAVGQNGKYHNYSHSSTTLYVQTVTQNFIYIAVSQWCNPHLLMPSTVLALSWIVSCIAVGIMHMLSICVGCFHPKLLTFIKKWKSHYTTSMTNKTKSLFVLSVVILWFQPMALDCWLLWRPRVTAAAGGCERDSWDWELFVLFVAECSVRDAVCVWIPGDAALQVDRRQPQSAPVFSPHLLGTLLSGISWHRGEVLGLEWQRILSC